MKHAIVDDRGPALLRARGVDLRGIVRAVWADIRSRQRRAGRLDDHAAVRQERLVHNERTIAASCKRGRARVAARARVVQGPDPDRVPEHDLLRERRLRRSSRRRETYFHHGAQALTLPEAALLAGIPADPARYDPVTNPKQAARAARRRYCARCASRAHHGRRLPPRRRGPAARSQQVRLPGHGGAGAVLRQLRQAAARRPLRRERVFGGGLRVHDDDRPRRPAGRPATRSRSG